MTFISTLERGPWGGSEELWSLTASRLLDAGYPVMAEVRKWPQLPSRILDLQRQGCKMVWRWPNDAYLRRLRHLVPPGGRRRSLRCRPRFVLISVAGDFPPLALLRDVCERKVAFAVLFHLVSEHLWPDDSQAEAYSKYLAAAGACFFVSRSNYSLMSSKLGADLPNGLVVRNPFNVGYSSSPAWPAEGDEYRMASVGRLDPGAKGDVLFQVLSTEKWRTRPLRVNLYGSGRCQEILKRNCEALRLHNVRFCGRTDDIEGIWAENHMLILPSRQEGMPLALVEAMLCGRAAIVTNVAGCPELIEDGLTGFIAEAPTAKCLDECMERAWERRAQWEGMGRLCAERVRETVPPDPVEEFKQRILQLMDR
ncbi:MAG: glycosyltransferase family 4 protein [Acidobacteria bacterium]|nr:glycosyltransferase family 4 protein [Acidobacteriota bacterium]